MTHDSVAVGEDGPTHQPVEQLESLRIIPGLQVLRPADDLQTAEAWRLALERTDGPTVLVLSRQALPQLSAPREDRDAVVELVATGSEAHLADLVAEQLSRKGYPARVVRALDRAHYAPSADITTVSIEAGVTDGWNGVVDLPLGIDQFGTCGPGDEVQDHHGFTAMALAGRIHEHLSRDHDR
jgi:transketolase